MTRTTTSKRFMMKSNQLVLVLDDNLETLRMLNHALQMEGYDIAIAADGSSAMALLEEHGPDLVILDIMMPGLDGFKVLNLIRQRSNVPAIILSARCAVTTVRNALVLGADHYVRKPFHTRELVARIRAKLRRAGPEATPSASLTGATIVTASHGHRKAMNNGRPR